MSWIPEMRLALDQAKLAAQKGEVPIGAILWRDGEILSSGHNERQTTGRTAAHAEMQALEQYNARTGQWRLPEGAVLIATVEPCLMCTGAFLWARVSKIVYGCPDTKGAALGLVQSPIEQGKLDHRLEIVPGILASECAEILSRFFENRRQEIRRQRELESCIF